jgi:hypothetical protein
VLCPAGPQDRGAQEGRREGGSRELGVGTKEVDRNTGGTRVGRGSVQCPHFTGRGGCCSIRDVDVRKRHGNKGGGWGWGCAGVGLGGGGGG